MKTLIKEIHEFLLHSGLADDANTRVLSEDLATRIESKFFVSLKRDVSSQVSELAREVCDIWNRELSISRGINPSATMLRLIQARLNEFSAEDLRKAALGRLAYIKSSEWHAKKENLGHAHNATIQFRTDELVRRWMYYFERGDDSGGASVTRQEDVKIDERFFE